MFFVLIGNREQNINFYGKENANSGVFKNNNNEVPVVKYKDENTEHINITLPKQEGEK
ncbi:MAG: hypothetical protein M0R46_09925 [Candidatus Muirbacterium halophilum]|nr:hypothetical protein [Candidatus Muirbacterium halophilum]